MVMFREDEDRIRAAERAAEPRWRKRLRFWIKATALLGCVIGLSLTVLSMQGGNSPALKSGIERYIGDATGYRAHIETLRMMTFFPVVGVAFEGLELYGAGTEGTPAEPALTAGKIILAMSFWDLLLDRREVRALDAENVSARAGVLAGREVFIRSLRIDGGGKDVPPAVVLDGRYGVEDMKGRIETERRGMDYGVPAHAPFAFSLGPLSAGGVYERLRHGRLRFVLSRAGTKETALSGMVEQEPGGDGAILYRLDLSMNGVPLRGDVARGKGGLSGTLDLSRIDRAGAASLLSLAASASVRLPRAAAIDRIDIQAGGAGISASLKEDGTLQIAPLRGGVQASLLDPSLPSAPLACAAAKMSVKGERLEAGGLEMKAGGKFYAGAASLEKGRAVWRVGPAAGKADAGACRG